VIARPLRGECRFVSRTNQRKFLAVNCEDLTAKNRLGLRIMIANGCNRRPADEISSAEPILINTLQLFEYCD
jgi:hypothetical protein